MSEETQVQDQTQEISAKLETIFRSRLDGISYVFPDGKTVRFKDRKYETFDQDEIDWLNKEIAAKHPHIYSGDPETVVDSNTGIMIQGITQEDGDDIVIEDETEDPLRIHDEAGKIL